MENKSSTQLFEALESGSDKIFNLIKKGVDLNGTNKNGETVFICAFKNCGWDVINYLLSNGAKSHPVRNFYMDEKYWSILVNDDYYVTRYGKFDTNGKTSEKHFETKEMCNKNAEKIINSKIKEGYKELGINLPGVKLETLITVEKAIENKSVKLMVNLDSDNDLLKEIFKIKILQELEITAVKPYEFILPKEIALLVNLKKLSLKGVKNISDEISKLTKLEELVIEGHNFSDASFIGNIKTLKKLEISCTNIKSLPDSIINLTSLEKIRLSLNENLKIFPEKICLLTNLKGLFFTQSEIESLPESIGKLSNLEDLYLSYNSKLTSLPKGIGLLKKLKKLSLLHCVSIRIFPIEIAGLKNLEKLELYNCKFENIPEEFLELDCDIKQLFKFLKKE